MDSKRHRNAQNCEVDEMLKSFLLDCMVDEQSTMKDAATLFEICLESVLPICNGTGSMSSMIRNNLKI